MSLKDLEENLYNKKSVQTDETLAVVGNESAEGKQSPYEPTFYKAGQEDKSAIWIKQDEEKKQKIKKIKKIALIAGGTVLVLGGLLWAVVFIRQSAFSEEKVTLSVSGPEKVQSGDLVTVAIHFANANRVDLKNAVLHIGYTENFRPAGNLTLEPEGPNASRYSIGTLKKKSEGTLELQGRFFGVKDKLTYIDVKMDYSSVNFSSTFAVENKYGAVISSSPLTLEVIGPQGVSAGGTVSFAVKYANDGQQKFRNLKIKADFPEAFSLSNSEPIPTKNGNIWYIGDIEGGQTGEIKIVGTLSGQEREEKQFKFFLGDLGEDDAFVAYSEVPRSVKIIGAPVTVTQTINDKKDMHIANAGDTLYFKVKFKNTGEMPLKDLILTEELNSPALDYASFSNGMGIQGNLDEAKGIVTWKPAGVEKLKAMAPGDEGQIDFTIKVKDVLPISSVKDKHFSFTATPRIDSPDIPTPEGQNKTIQGNVVTTKINSKLIVKEQGFYNDQEMANTGPIPLKVGEETTFTIRLSAENIANDTTNAKVTVILAPGVEWKSNFLPKDANIEFNGRSGEMVWNIGTMPAGIGIITDPKEIAFQIAVKPSVDSVGNAVQLTKSVKFTADDTFTGQKLEASLGGKDSYLSEDISVGTDGKVVQ